MTSLSWWIGGELVESTTKLPRKGATHLSEKAHASTAFLVKTCGLSWRHSGQIRLLKGSDPVIEGVRSG